MTEEIHLSDVRSTLEELTFPITREEAVEAMSGVTVLYADGQESLAVAIDRIEHERFETVDELETDLLSSAPIEAIGEPGQSEGDA